MVAAAFFAGSMLTSCNTPTDKVDNAKENAIDELGQAFKDMTVKNVK